MPTETHVKWSIEVTQSSKFTFFSFYFPTRLPRHTYQSRIMVGESFSRTLLALILLVNFSARVTGVDEVKQCKSALFFLESRDLMRMNVSTCFTQISWDQVQLEKREKIISKDQVQLLKVWRLRESNDRDLVILCFKYLKDACLFIIFTSSLPQFIIGEETA